MAALTSLGIGLCNLYILKKIPSSDLHDFAVLAYILGGPVGIVTSMSCHQWIKTKTQSLSTTFKVWFQNL